MKSFHQLTWIGLLCLIGPISATAVTKTKPGDRFSNIGIDPKAQGRPLTADETKSAEADLQEVMGEIKGVGRPPGECDAVPQWQKGLIVRQTLGYDPGKLTWNTFRYAFQNAVRAGTNWNRTMPSATFQSQASSCKWDGNEKQIEPLQTAHIIKGFVQGDADLNVCPKESEINAHDRDHEVTIGDLHGNTMKMIYFLIREGVLRAKPREGKNSQELLEEIYAKLKAIYEGGDSSGRAEFESFERILNGLEVVPNGPKIRFIGDELADRGKNDYFTLSVLSKLHDEAAPFEIIASNHSMEFIRYCERELTQGKRITTDQWGVGDPSFMVSLMNLRKVTESDAQLGMKVKKIFENVYRPHLKLLSYSVNRDEPLSLYSHAPIGVEGIQSLAETFGIPECQDRAFLEASRVNFIDCVRKTNAKFYEVRDLGKLSDLFDDQRNKIDEKKLEISKRDGISLNDAIWKVDQSKFGFKHVIWNQSLSNVDRVSTLKDGTHVVYVHGHYSPQTPEEVRLNSEKYVVNLDHENELGKGRIVVRLGPDKKPVLNARGERITKVIPVNQGKLNVYHFQNDPAAKENLGRPAEGTSR